MEPEKDAEDHAWPSFLLENEYGLISVTDLATYDVNQYLKKIKNGEIKMTTWVDKFVNEFGGYKKYEYPKEGENVALLCIYGGYSELYNTPSFYFGLNEQFYDTLSDD